MTWTLAARNRSMTSSAIRDLLKLTERPGIVSFAGGLPSPQTFPVEAFAEACRKVLADDGPGALQYAATEGLPALREAVAAGLPWPVDPANILITTGSQQGLDLAGKVLIDEGSRILVETPTYLGALQAFAPMVPQVQPVANDADGIDPADLRSQARGPNGAARFLYLLPNFQNPTGRTLGEARRAAVSKTAQDCGLPILEDNPYGELWFDEPPPLPMTARAPDDCIYMGSFSKVLAPGLRLGFVVAPPAIHQRLVLAKQAADLHSPSFNQRVVAEVMKDGFLDRHVPTIRNLYRTQRDAMLAALVRNFAGHDAGSKEGVPAAPCEGAGDFAGMRWNKPAGGMFLWLRLPEGLDASELLPLAVERGVAFVPGAAFYAGGGDPRTLRLSFVTATSAQIDAGVAALADAVRSLRTRTSFNACISPRAPYSAGRPA